MIVIFMHICGGRGGWGGGGSLIAVLFSYSAFRENCKITNIKPVSLTEIKFNCVPLVFLKY